MTSTQSAQLYLGSIPISGNASGVPPAPVITNVNGPLISFESGGEGDLPTLAYIASVEPLTNERLEVTFEDDMSSGEVLLQDFIIGVEYTLYLYAFNSFGTSDPAITDPFTLDYNELSQETGTYSVELDYNGSGETWAVHTWDTGGTYTPTVNSNAYKFKILTVGGGGTGYQWTPADHYGPGAGGGGVVEDELRLDIGSQVNIVVGANGQASSVNGLLVAGAGSNSSRGSAGGRSGSPQSKPGGGGYHHPDYWLGGGGGGAGGNGPGATAGGAAGGAGLASTITGASVTYARGGGGGSGGQRGATYSNKGSGGGGGGLTSQGAGPGRHGFVAIAYQIGVSSKRQIEIAKAQRAARALAYEQGLKDGLLEAGITDDEG